jgi:hypothetical protein
VKRQPPKINVMERYIAVNVARSQPSGGSRPSHTDEAKMERAFFAKKEVAGAADGL